MARTCRSRRCPTTGPSPTWPALPTAASWRWTWPRLVGHPGPGQRILIYGASGAIGTSAVQLAKHLGAHVTAVCNTANLAVVRSLGPDIVIDYTTTDFTATGETYDVVFDAVGKSSFRKCRKLVRRGGRYVSSDLGFMWQNPFLSLATLKFAPKQVRMPIPKYTQDKVIALRELVESDDFRAVIDRTYALDQIVDATRYVETQQKTGNVLIAVISDAAADSPPV